MTGAVAFLTLSCLACCHAQAASDPSCPRLFLRPEVLDYVGDVLGRLEKQRASWQSPQVVRLIGQELPSELRLKTPFNVLEANRGEIDNIRPERWKRAGHPSGSSLPNLMRPRQDT